MSISTGSFTTRSAGPKPRRRGSLTAQGSWAGSLSPPDDLRTIESRWPLSPDEQYDRMERERWAIDRHVSKILDTARIVKNGWRGRSGCWMTQVGGLQLAA